jgi:hypothetical protein
MVGSQARLTSAAVNVKSEAHQLRFPKPALWVPSTESAYGVSRHDTSNQLLPIPDFDTIAVQLLSYANSLLISGAFDYDRRTLNAAVFCEAINPIGSHRHTIL